MSDIFVSHRRGRPSPGGARRLADDLARRLGAERVHWDDADPATARFEQTVEAAARRCRAMVALVDRRWIARAHGLDDADDWVRRELGIAFERKIPVVPVLAEGVTLEELLEVPLSAPLDALPVQPPFTLGAETREADLARLVRHLEEVSR
ncbi:MAG: TIR domain-containing protein [Myxococcota bacterium]